MGWDVIALLGLLPEVLVEVYIMVSSDVFTGVLDLMIRGLSVGPMMGE